MKKIINSKYMSWFRKAYLLMIYNKIDKYIEEFCCIAASHSFYGSIICWKDLKEVKENMNSNHLFLHIKKDISVQNCSRLWFGIKENRLNFLKECLNKFN